MRKLVLWVGFLVLGLSSGARAISIEPDAFSPGTDISYAIPGITLYDYDESFSSGPGRFGPVYALSSAFASTGNLVFGHSGNSFLEPGEWAHFVVTHRASLWIDFDTPVNFFSIDAIANSPGDVGYFQYYDSASQLLGHETAVIPITGEVLNLSILRQNADIARVVITGDGTSTVYDNATYAVPEPSTALLLGLGLTGMAVRSGRGE